MSYLNSKGISKLQDVRFWLNDRLGEAMGSLRADHQISEKELDHFRSVIHAMDDLITFLGGETIVKRGPERFGGGRK